MRILAHPALDKNIHQIEAEGDLGKLFAQMENVPSPANPKTSHMVSLSAIGLLDPITSTLDVGSEHKETLLLSPLASVAAPLALGKCSSLISTLTLRVVGLRRRDNSR